MIAVCCAQCGATGEALRENTGQCWELPILTLDKFVESSWRDLPSNMEKRRNGFWLRVKSEYL